MKRQLVFLRTNTLSSEPRLQKEAAALVGEYDCQFLLWDRYSRGHEHRGMIFRHRAPFGSLTFLFWLPAWWWFVVRQLAQLKPDVIHACDFETVLPALFYRLSQPQTKIVYDIWDVAASRLPRFVGWLKPLIDWSERRASQTADAVLVPDAGRFDQLGLQKTAWPKQTEVILNTGAVAEHLQMNQLKTKKPLVLSYVGVLQKTQRGLEHLVRLAQTKPSITIHIAGYGPDEDWFTHLLTNQTVPNLIFHGRVSVAEAKQLNEQADILVSLLNPAYPNNRWATSTKFFDAISLGKPFITTTGTATARLVQKTGWGVTVDFTAQSLLKIIEEIQRGSYTFNLEIDQVKDLAWSHQEAKLRTLYQELWSIPASTSL